MGAAPFWRGNSRGFATEGWSESGLLWNVCVASRNTFRSRAPKPSCGCCEPTTISPTTGDSRQTEHTRQHASRYDGRVRWHPHAKREANVTPRKVTARKEPHPTQMANSAIDIHTNAQPPVYLVARGKGGVGKSMS
jgi:hypothetical protein